MSTHKQNCYSSWIYNTQNRLIHYFSSGKHVSKCTKLQSPIILRASTDMPVHEKTESSCVRHTPDDPRLTVSANQPYKKCLSLPNMAPECLR